MEITTSLQGKSIHVVIDNAEGRTAYEEVLHPFLMAGAAIAFYETPEAYINAVSPDAFPDILITSGFKAAMQGPDMIHIMRMRGFIGTSLVGSSTACKILDYGSHTRHLVRLRLTDHSVDLPRGFVEMSNPDPAMLN